MEPSYVKLLLIVSVAATLVLPLSARAAAPQVLVVGDSLAVGTEPYLGAMLAGSDVTWGAQSGRTTPQGIQVLRAGLRDVTPQVVVVSLGTNDGPDPQRFGDRLRRVLAAVPAGTCVVWSNVNRPPRKGPYAGINRVLWRVAARDPRLVIVDWNWAVAVGKVRLPDGLHPDAAGYEYRSRMIATAVARGCPPALAA